MSKSSLSDLLPPNVWLFPDAVDDLAALDKGRRIVVIKALAKIAQNPSAFGKELGNQQERLLAGFRSAYVDGKSIRIVWKVARDGTVEVAVVAVVQQREGMLAYETAAKRREDVEAWVAKVLDASRRKP
jgi:mRNA interferase RelE/StbE